MTDISKCNNPNCAIKEFCFRYLADADDYQSYIVIDKEVDTSDDCDEFWECTSKEALAKLNKDWR